MSGCEHNSHLTENCATCISIRADMHVIWREHAANKTPYYRENPRWLDLMQVTDEHEKSASHQVFFEYCYEDHGCLNDNLVLEPNQSKDILARLAELERRCTQLENDRTSD